MAPVQWYYAHQDKQIGPVSPAQMRQLAAAGVLQPDDLVWSEGIQRWTPARNVAGLFDQKPATPADTFAKGATPENAVPETASPAPPPAQTAADSVPPQPRQRRAVFDVVLDYLRAQFSPHFVESTATIFARCGHYGLYAVMLLWVFLSLAAAIKSESLYNIRLGFATLLILVVLQYAASRVWAPMERLLSHTSGGRIPSPLVPDCLALLCIAAGLIMLLCYALTAATVAVTTNDYWLILSGLSAFILFEYLGFVSLNPQAIGVSIAADTPPADEALGTLCFLLKAGLRLVPVAFGVGVLAGILHLARPCYLLFAAHAPAVGTGEPLALNLQLRLQSAQAAALDTISWIICYAALPLAAYLVFLLCHLLIELIRALLPAAASIDTPADAADGRR